MKSGKLTTKIISLFLCAVMLLSVMPLGVINAFASSDTVPEGYTGIYDIEDLDAVRNDPDGNYILMADIDMTEATAAGGEWDYNGTGWRPIGETYSYSFSGIFDGNGHSITGMRIKDSNAAFIGLFGSIRGGTVRNLRIVNADIQDAHIKNAGAIAGYTSSATFEKIAIDNLLMNVENDNSASSYNSYGGLVGYASGTSSVEETTIRKSYVTGEITVKGANTHVGGIAGTGGLITDCYNASVITGRSTNSNVLAGGISGCFGTITNCVNIGVISETCNVRCGAINGSAATLSHCYYKKGTASRGNSGTNDAAETAVALTEEQMKQQSVFSYLDFEDTWVLDVASGAAYPQLKDNRQFPEAEDEHDVVPEGYTPIYDIEDLDAIRNDLDGNYILMADIDMTEATAEGGEWDYNGTGWRPIGETFSEPFSGIFDGNGHSITGMRIKDSDAAYIGLFGFIDSGTVKNLRMVNADIQDTSVKYAGTIAGYAYSATFENIAIVNLAMNVRYVSSINYCYYGGIVGYTKGTSDNKTTISKSYVSGEIYTSASADALIGGIVGNAYSSTNISNCYNTAAITGNGVGYSSYVGGISGNNGIIINCINVGTVSGLHAYIGAINGTNAGLVGCYYKKGTAYSGKYNTSDSSSSAVALTEEQMKLQSVYGYLDFDNTWFLDTDMGMNYPQLQSCPEKPAESIVITSYPSKTSYLQHEELDVAGLKITVNYEHGIDPEVKDVTTAMVSGYDATVIGTQTLTVIYFGKTVTFDVVVSPRPVTSVALDKTEVNLEVAMTEQLTATVLPDNATDKELTWTSDDESVVTVDNTGLVTAQGTGTATVTVTASNGVSASAEITVLADHTYGDTVTTITATCFATGSAYKTCTICGHVENITLPVDSTNHSGGTEVRNAVTGNCGEAGYTGNTYCLGCNVMLTEGEEIPATENHHYESEITSESTCAVAGIRTYTCSVCNDSYTEELELSDEHTWGELEIVQDATCEEDGCKARKCTECGAVQQATTVTLLSSTYPESAHNYSNNTNVYYSFSYPGATTLHLTFSTNTSFESGYDYLYIYEEDGSLYGKYSGTSLAGQTITLDGSSFGLRLTSDSSGTRYGFSFSSIVAEVGEGEIIPATGHDYAEVITTPVTCEEDGVKTFTCANCGDSYTEDIPSTGHNYSSSITTEVTCETYGVITYTCSNCGDVYTEDIPSTGHEYISEITSESTCAVAGIRTYTCSVCNDSYTEELELSDEHTWGELEIVQDATCEEDGYKARKCTECGEVLEDGIILVPSSEYPESEHDYSNNSDISYYFSYPGATRLYLTFSDETQFENYSDFLYIYDEEGNYNRYTGRELAGEEITIEGDYFRLRLETDGSSRYYGFSFDSIEADMGGAEIIPATGHNYSSEITSESTCVVAGIRTYTCSVCNDSYTEELELSDEHTWGEPEVIEDATCTTDGYKAIKCTVCGELSEVGMIIVPSSEYPESEHNYSNDSDIYYYFEYPGATSLYLTFSDETFFENGYDYLYVYDEYGNYGCFTGNQLVGVIVGLEGDSFTLRLVSDGSSTRYGFSFEKIQAQMGVVTEVIPATGHDYSGEIISEATCCADGVTIYTCTNCGDEYTETIELDPNDHTWGELEIVQDATCEEDGYKAKTCTECGEVSEGDIILIPSSEYPESEHNYSNNSDIYYYFEYPGATRLYLTFSDETEYEYRYDNLYIYYDDEGNYFDSANGFSGARIVIEGDCFTLRFTSDDSNTYYGFSFDKIEAEMSGTVVIPATGHNYSSEITAEADCRHDGTIKYTCANCSDTYTETIESDPDAHDMSEWEVITEPTCNTDGKKVGKCAECGHMAITIITLDPDEYPESDHDYLNNENKDYLLFGYEGADKLYLTFSSSTYFEDGCDFLFIYDSSGDYICHYTGNSLAGKTITIPGDSFSLRLETDGSNTCYGFSFDSIVAEVSDGSADYEIIPATGDHDYVYSTTREATCTREGEITYTCSDCGDSYTESTGRTAHTPGEWQVIANATADADGVKIRSCTVCGAETDRETIPAGSGVTRYLGDANGDGKVTAADARLILRHSARIEILSDNMIRLADVNSDGKVNASDARIALRTASKLEELIIYG